MVHEAAFADSCGISHGLHGDRVQTFLGHQANSLLYQITPDKFRLLFTVVGTR